MESGGAYSHPHNKTQARTIMHTQFPPQASPEYNIQLLKLTQVLEILPVSKTTLWRYVKAGKFPEPRKLGRSAFWVKEEVENAVRQLVM